jgi:hypothetical protein
MQIAPAATRRQAPPEATVMIEGKLESRACGKPGMVRQSRSLRPRHPSLRGNVPVKE